ncbi:hypothetical protein SAMN00790413_02275 [Deinococcus hopiensis KR-140]|uniref:Uncharacterized protein n=1 Tax=Deinococcus hopiensis KR-140 TaxID=695939 RepID=A0A1W1VLS5_9DEIO|nr:hypothetical protein SAMN00790413_02275 [Deinococcus hopiensis KR-140]
MPPFLCSGLDLLSILRKIDAQLSSVPLES